MLKLLLFLRAFVMVKFYAQLFSVAYKYFCTSGCATNRGDAKYSVRMGKNDKSGKLVKKTNRWKQQENGN